MKRLIFLFLLFFSFVSFSHAGLTTKQLRNQDEYAAAMSKQMRNYDSMEAKVNYNNLKNQINGAMSGSKALSDGSRAASASSIAKAADAARAAGTIAGRFAKANGYMFVGSVALDGLLKGIQWLKDDGSKVVKKPFDASSLNCGTGSACDFANYLYEISGGPDDGSKFSTGEAACAFFNSKMGTGWWGSTVWDGRSCIGTSSGIVISAVSVITNPYYSPTSPFPSGQPATQQELIDAIQNYLQQHPNSDITNNIYVSAYSPDMQFALDDAVNVLASEMADEMAQSLDAASKSATGNASVTIYNPAGDIIVGSATSQIDLYGTGSTTTTAETSTTTNADGTTSTTTTQGTQQSDWPPLCDYAAKFCEWMDWTKESPDTPPDDQQQDINDQGIFSRTFNTTFTLPASCPPDVPFVLNNKYLQVNDVISLKWLCIIFTFLGYPLVFVSHCVGVWILYETVIRKSVKVA